MKKLWLLCCVILLPACTITQNIEPAEITKNAEICIIENPAVRAGFLKEYLSVLSSKRIAYKMVNVADVPEDCEWTSPYTANWTWDLTIYMSYAEIKIFHKGSLDGQAIYDSRSGSSNMGKFIDAEPKVRELVNQLMQFKSASLFFRSYG